MDAAKRRPLLKSLDYFGESLNKVIVKPSQQHYQEILRSILALVIICALFYVREFGEMNEFTEFLHGRHAISGVSELIISVLMGAILAFGIDRALLPVLKKISSKPPIELTANGIRYHYNNAHADILFTDIQYIGTKQDPHYCIELRTKGGQNIELSGYSNMELLEAHLKQGM